MHTSVVVFASHLALFLFAVEIFSQDVKEDNTKSNVVILNELNFDETIANNEFVFVDFYSPLCGHCKRLEPEYEEIATRLKEEGSPIVIAKVDCIENRPLGERFGVRGFPTLKLFRQGIPLDYEGERSSSEIIKWLKKKTGPPSLHITSAEAFKTFFAQLLPRIVAFVNDEPSLAVWNALASSGKLDDFALAHVTDQQSALLLSDDAAGRRMHQELKPGSVVVFKEAEESVLYEGSFELEPLLEWLLEEGYPLVEEVGQRIWSRCSSSSKALLVIFLSDVEEESMELVRTVATRLKGKVCTSFSTTLLFAERWGSSGKVFPTSILITWKDGKPIPTIYNEETAPLTVETCLSFVEEALKGTYKGFQKSQPVPETNDGLVTVVVGKTFESIVYDKEKDVFIEFYAPWCGHSKNLAPIWEQLGEYFASVDTVVIAKMDATANYIPDNIDIKGFPTLIFFPADNKQQQIPFTENKDFISLKDFVTQHASRSISEKEDL